MRVQIRDIKLYARTMHTRLPFRYGIATMTALPHLVVQIDVEIDGARAAGVAADGLPPKWFTKYPDTTYAQDLQAMRIVIEAAVEQARAVEHAASVFDFWRHCYSAQARWASGTNYPSLLWGFGVSLVERALIDGFCRATRQSFAQAVRKNTLGIDLGWIHPELAGSLPAQWLPTKPLQHVIVRHTVGLSDPLERSDQTDGERLDDGLPETLAESIAAYGLTHFKIKLSGFAEQDLTRLCRIARLLAQMAAPNYVVTLDGNEQYGSVASLQEFWRIVVEEPALHEFLQHVAFVEQPLHRDASLQDEVGQALAAWEQHPPLLIDESDGALDSLPTALMLGYAGTSHKNCKGVFKGIANRCLLERRQRLQANRRLMMSAEDLANVGPIALLQDLAVVATLGLSHAERNGHHYFRGLSMWPALVGERILENHGDLYERRRDYATLQIRQGSVALNSVVAAPFGLGCEYPLDEIMGGLEITF